MHSNIIAIHTLHEDIAIVQSLKSCTKQKNLRKGSKLHGQALKTGLLRHNIFVGSATVHMYAACGALAKAQQVFDELPSHNVVSWTGLITGYVQHGQGKRALDCFELMKDEGFSPNAITFASVLRACASVGLAIKGKEIHADICNMHLLETDTVLGNALIDMYSKCGDLTMAEQSFAGHLVRDTVSWNALVAGYCQHHHYEKVLVCFEQLIGEGLIPDVVTFLCMLKACGVTKAISKGKQVHAEVVRQGFLKGDTSLGNALVDMYAKWGALTEARQVFDELPNRNIISWTILITGYHEHGHSEEALDCFQQMLHEDLTPDAVTFFSVLKACSSVGAAERGQEVHAEIMRTGLLYKSCELGSALIDMYSKCGALEKAHEVFSRLSGRDIVAWTALITGYCQHGYNFEAMRCFERMQIEGFSPDAVTLSCILKLCGVVGATERGQMLFDSISKNYGMIPAAEHHICMVDLFGREGQFDKAVTALRQMPSSLTLPSWFALLDACLKWGNMELGKIAFEQKFQSDG
ncbi:hypothetical protein KP509_25G002100 [Ceratopteris richardii]|uniref:Pentatricopeptide repeat-containing protein n=1 Tax=Ceratopteris richardii TaxID=49495 RepID=A0A8T2RPY4_CERRI|nr:hypothetical protein KP509_25G002100 [Ceratopteris richardii]